MYKLFGKYVRITRAYSIVNKRFYVLSHLIDTIKFYLLKLDNTFVMINIMQNNKIIIVLLNIKIVKPICLDSNVRKYNNR